jgi:hypothetical protein
MVSRKGRDAVVQHALLPSESPLEKTPHKTGIVSVALMAAVVALFQMAAENSGPADRDRSHDTALRHRHRSVVLQTIICAVAGTKLCRPIPRCADSTPRIRGWSSRLRFNIPRSSQMKGKHRASSPPPLGIFRNSEYWYS